MLRRLPLAALVCAWLATAPAVASAAVFLETSVEEVARASDAVVRGRVERRRSFYSEDRRLILTEITLTVSDAWKGSPGARVQLVVPGGSVGDFAQMVDGAPAFQDGEDVVVFLSRRADRWELNGLALGKYRLEAGSAMPDLARVAFQGPPVKAGEKRVGEMPVEELRRRVSGAKR